MHVVQTEVVVQSEALFESWHAVWACAALLGAGAAGYALRGWLRRMRFAARRRRGFAGEAEAETLLTKRGYRILRRQPSRTLRYTLDGAAVDVVVRADLLVERRGRRYLAEVKTGRRAPQLRTAETRRQLLEYAHAFEVHGVLLIDADARTVQQVGLPKRSSRPRHTLLALVCALLLGAVGAHWLGPLMASLPWSP